MKKSYCPRFTFHWENVRQKSIVKSQQKKLHNDEINEFIRDLRGKMMKHNFTIVYFTIFIPYLIEHLRASLFSFKCRLRFEDLSQSRKA